MDGFIVAFSVALALAAAWGAWAVWRDDRADRADRRRTLRLFDALIPEIEPDAQRDRP